MDSSGASSLHGDIDGEENEEVVGGVAMRLALNIGLGMILKSAIELNLLEIIAEAGTGAFLSPTRISAELPTKNPDAPMLVDRILRLLASHSVVRCSAETREDGEVHRLYGMGPMSKFFLKNHDMSVANLLLLCWDNIFVDCWFHLNDAILEGGLVSFDRRHGMHLYEYLGTDLRFNQVFNQSMANLTSLTMKKILDVYTGFEDVQLLVDVGGGVGINLSLIISKYPHIKGINYDLPHVIATAPSYSSGLMKHEGGDMFVDVPRGDAILLKHILHNWGDSECLKLLKNCYEALPKSGKVIVLESVLSETPENSLSDNIGHLFDSFMININHGSRERTEKEFRELATKSGFSSCELICKANYLQVLEFHKNEILHDE